MTKYYYESHITIDPVFDEARDTVAEFASMHNFKLAKLIMRKREADAETPAQDDTFMTGHSRKFKDIEQRTKDLVIMLNTAGFKVRRYKIEDTILDSRMEDIWNLLKN